MGVEGGNLIQWANRKLSRGEIESLVDPKIQDQYDINSVWKVAYLARRCTEHTSSRRPTISDVVTELKESLDLAMSMEQPHIERINNSLTDASRRSTFEMAYMGEIPMTGPKVR
jgi:gas vesicle protein